MADQETKSGLAAAAITKRLGNPQRKESAAFIRALAKRHRIAYSQTGTDVWAYHVTRLAGDDVVLDDVEQLLIALQRAGHLSRPEALELQINYLRESKL